MFSTGWLAKFWQLIGGSWEKTFIRFGEKKFEQGLSEYEEAYQEPIEKVWFAVDQKNTEEDQFNMFSADIDGNNVKFHADMATESKVKWFVQG